MHRIASALIRVARVARPVAVARAFPARALATAAPGGQVQTFLDKKEVTDRVLSVLKNFEKINPASVTPTAHFVNDLGLDSLDAVEVCMALEEEFIITIPDAEAEKILSVEDAINFVATHPHAK